MPRKRNAESRDLPANLYCYKKGEATYFYFEHPIRHTRDPLGTDRDAAIRTVNAINLALVGQGIDPQVRIPKTQVMTIAEVVDHYLPKAVRKLGSENSRKATTNYLERIKKDLGRLALTTVTVRDLSQVIEDLPDSSYIKMRTHIESVFAHALSQGFLPHSYGNPAAVLEKRSEPKAKRQRLSYDQFKEIYNIAPIWVQTAMDIMLHTGLRPIDVVNLRFDQVIDGVLYTAVRKTGKHLGIELDAEEQAIIRRARHSGTISPYIVHKRPGRIIDPKNRSKQKTHSTQLTTDDLSKTFSELRNQLQIGVGKKGTPPTIYEIRSLSSRLYEKTGRDKKQIQNLLAHTNERMTNHYLDDRTIKPILVKAGLQIRD